MSAAMNEKEEPMKSELKEQSPAMKLTGAHLDSESRTFMPATVNEHHGHSSSPSAKVPIGLKSSVANLASMPIFAGVLSNPELWQKWKANKVLAIAFVFVIFQGLLLVQLQKAGTYEFLGNFSMNSKDSAGDREKNYQEALFLDPKSSVAAGQIGRIAFAQGDFEKAKKYANFSLHLKSNPDVYDVLTSTYLAQNNLAEAEKSLEMTLKEFPDAHLAIAQAELNWVQKQLGKNRGSRELYEKALSNKAFPQLALDFHHMGYQSREGVSGFPKNPYLTLAFEDIAIDLHVERIDPLRLLYAHCNKSSAYNEMYQPEKARAELRMIIDQAKQRSDKASIYTNLKISDRLLGDYASLLKDSKAEAQLNGWSENHYDLAEASFFAKDYTAAIKNANKGLSGGNEDEEEPWSLLFKNLSMAALHQRVDLSVSKQSFQKYLETEIANLRNHNLNKRAEDLQLLLSPLEKAQ
jgi:hypothetical protein